MSDAVPNIDLGLTADGKPVVMVGTTGDEAQDMATLLRLAPGVALPAHARDAALLVNHLAHGNEYEVITDPEAFHRTYEARLAREDPTAPWQENVIRLRDFGVPDFATIKPPRFDGGKLVFFARDTFLGVPYRVDLPHLQAAAEYKPVPLAPLPAASEPPRPIGPQRPPPKPPLKPLTPEEEAARATHQEGDLPSKP